VEIIRHGIDAHMIRDCGDCSDCDYAEQVRGREYHCSNPKYPNKKVIYKETYGVLKKLGCGGYLHHVR
jgi:hypothetical protein